MKVPVSWLSEFIDKELNDIEALRQTLDSMGHEVEGVVEFGAGIEGVLVARVESIEAHPDADSIRLCHVSTGGETTPVVCGAWNFDAGAVVAWAPPGATLPDGTGIDKKTIRGIESNGMICSEVELGLGDEASGILVLDRDAPLGSDFGERVREIVFDLKITPNRPDAMSMLGIARDLAAFWEAGILMPSRSLEEDDAVLGPTIRIEDPVGCLRFVGRPAADVHMAESPYWLRRRLQMCDVRPISNVVDITNYVMLELGQPLHAFDQDRLLGGAIVVRKAADGEALTTLDEVDRTLTNEDLVVADAENASGLAGTIGGGYSEVSSETTNVLIEGAAWDAPTVLLMAHRHGVRTEASARFERGVDPNLPPVAVSRAAHLMNELAGAAIGPEIDEVSRPVKPWGIRLEPAYVRRVLGDAVDVEEMESLLTRMHMDVERVDEGSLAVTIPTFRPDLTRPVDLIEEIARLHGIDNFAESVPLGRGGGWSVEQQRTFALRTALAGAGLSEANNLSFMDPTTLDSLGVPSDHELRKMVGVSNPLREDQPVLRTTLLPGLLRSARRNQGRGLKDVALFEIGKVFFDRPAELDPRIPDQPDRLAWVVTGGFGDSEIGSEARQVDLYSSTAIWRLISHRLDLGHYELRSETLPGLHPGRAASVVTNGQVIGSIGELHPAAARSYEVSGRVAVGELDLASLVQSVGLWQFNEPSTFPPLEFDLAFQVDELVPASDIAMATARSAAELVESVQAFDEFRGDPLDAGTKSLAFRYVLRAQDRTLTSEDLAPIRDRMIEAASGVGASLRGAV